MEEKECGKCHETKPIKEFNITGAGKWRGKKRHAWCKSCTKEYDRLRYTDPALKKKKRENAVVFRTRNSIKIYKYLRKHPCVDCEETNILTLEFDHIDEKFHNVSNMAGRFAWEVILKEIKKCEVVCANCHRIRTATRAGWTKLAYQEANKE